MLHVLFSLNFLSLFCFFFSCSAFCSFFMVQFFQFSSSFVSSPFLLFLFFRIFLYSSFSLWKTPSFSWTHASLNPIVEKLFFSKIRGKKSIHLIAIEIYDISNICSFPPSTSFNINCLYPAATIIKTTRTTIYCRVLVKNK